LYIPGIIHPGKTAVQGYCNPRIFAVHSDPWLCTAQEIRKTGEMYAGSYTRNFT